MSGEEFVTELEKRCLALLLRRQKAERSPYVPISFLKRVADYKGVIKSLRRKALVFYYKRDGVGLTEDGKYIALGLIEEGY